MTAVIYFYQTRKEYGEFSNFARFPITLEGKRWPSSEHYYQAKKHLHDPQYEEAIRHAQSPFMAAHMGRDPRHPLRSDWEQVKDVVMYRALYAKFTQHPALQTLLLGTGEAQLVEHTPHDTYWADGGDGRGLNRLGVLLMTLRDELRTGEAGRFFSDNAEKSRVQGALLNESNTAAANVGSDR